MLSEHAGVNLAAVRLWVDALVSGGYEQGAEELLRLGKYCCMGVAAQICPVPMARDIGVRNRGRVEFDGEGSWMPEKVREWLGLDGISPTVAEWEWLTPEEQLIMDREGCGGRDLSAHQANDVLKWDLVKIGRSVERFYLSGVEEKASVAA